MPTPYAVLVASALVVGTFVASCGSGEGASNEESSGADVEVGECDEARACDPGEVCRSPEQHAWNRCEERSRARCETGQVGDDCGNCFGSCLGDADCGEGKRCNGAYCESPRRCFAQ